MAEMNVRILLIGMMGVGKSTVGRAAAGALGWTYLDSDEQVRTATGRTVKEISQTQGPQVLHRFEGEALIAALSWPTSVVVSVAGGALMENENRQLVRREPHVVWLRASLETMVQRVGVQGDRPFIGTDPTATIAELYEVRRPLYDEVATLTIDVDDLTPTQVVETILTTWSIVPSSGPTTVRPT